jgi:tetrathionate reductase subunit B
MSAPDDRPNMPPEGRPAVPRRNPRGRPATAVAPAAPLSATPALTPAPVAAPAPTPVAAPAPLPVASVAPSAPDLPLAAGLVPLTELAPAIAEISVSRRRFLGFGLAIVGGLSGATALSRLFPVFEETSSAPPPIVPAYDPVGKAWTFVVDSASCIGCGLCVVACKEENAVTEDGRFARTWVERHAVATDGTVYVDSPAGGMEGFPPTSTAPGAEGATIDAAFFEPRLCMQCENPPCISVCPVGATYKTEDGIILVDPRRCIGCGYCVVACPYGARYLTPAAERAPNDTPGVADKCTWCYHRISRGSLPACVEVCPVGARKFGDRNDPEGEIATLLRERAPKALHPEFGTRPRVLYLGPSVEEA